MADKNKETELFDEPFELELDDGSEYSGGGFEGDETLIIHTPEEEGEASGEAEPVDEEAAENKEEPPKKEAAENKEEPPKKEAAESEVVGALKSVTESFNQQLMQMNSQFASQMQNMAEKIERFSKPAKKEVEPPPPPTEDEWEKDPNAAAQKMYDRNKALEAMSADESVDEPEAVATDRAKLRAEQEESYKDAVNALPDISKAGSEERDVFTKIYFNPKYRLSDHPQGPVLAAIAANFYLQKAKDKAVETKTEPPSPVVEEAQKIISDTRAKKHGMTRSGNKRDGGGITLSEEHRRVAKQLGVSEDSMKAGLSSLGFGG